MKLCLSLSGGGIRGLVQARVVSLLPPAITKNVSLYAGTSTGGILAIGLALGLDPAAMERMYVNKGAEIFPRVWWRRGLSAFVPKYSADGLERALIEAYGLNARFSSAPTPVMVNTYDRNLETPYHFKSWRQEAVDFYAWEPARATSAAPSYFPSYLNRYWDGGICANDPALDAYCEALTLWPDDEIIVLSIGNGSVNHRTTPLGNQGIFGIGKALGEALLNSPDEATQHRMKVLVGKNYYRLDALLPAKVNHAMDDASPENIKHLQEFADELVYENAAMIQEVAKRLSSPDSPRSLSIAG